MYKRDLYLASDTLRGAGGRSVAAGNSPAGAVEAGADVGNAFAAALGGDGLPGGGGNVAALAVAAAADAGGVGSAEGRNRSAPKHHVGADPLIARADTRSAFAAIGGNRSAVDDDFAAFVLLAAADARCVVSSPRRDGRTALNNDISAFVVVGRFELLAVCSADAGGPAAAASLERFAALDVERRIGRNVDSGIILMESADLVRPFQHDGGAAFEVETSVSAHVTRRPFGIFGMADVRVPKGYGRLVRNRNLVHAELSRQDVAVHGREGGIDPAQVDRILLHLHVDLVVASVLEPDPGLVVGVSVNIGLAVRFGQVPDNQRETDKSLSQATNHLRLSLFWGNTPKALAKMQMLSIYRIHFR